MLKGTIDFYNFTPLLQTLTLAGGHKVSTKQNLLATVFAHFSAGQDKIWSGVEAIFLEDNNTTFEWHLVKQGKLLLFYWLH